MKDTNIPASLQDLLQKGEVVPFVGAGVSMAVKRNDGTALFPSWQELLLQGADRLEADKKPRAAKIVRLNIEVEEGSVPNYEAAAECLRRELGESAWIMFLKSVIDIPMQNATDESLALARSIWHLGSKLIITTNYDWVLHWACPEPQELRTWNVSAPAEQLKLIRHGAADWPTIWHLHGHIEATLDIVLTPSGYSRLYGDGASRDNVNTRYRTALRVLESQFARRSFLFIGFSFEDVRLGTELIWIDNVLSNCTGPHYALVHQREVKAIRDKFLMSGLKVEVIPFAGFGPPLRDLADRLVAATRHDGFSTRRRLAAKSQEAESLKGQTSGRGTFSLRVELVHRDMDPWLVYRLGYGQMSIQAEDEVRLDPALLNLGKRIKSLGEGKDLNGDLLSLEEVEGKLKAIGRRLYRHILPEKARVFYREYRNKMRSIHVTSNVTSIPWEIIKPYDDSRAEEVIDDDFWGTRFRITRWLPDVPPPPSVVELKNFAVVAIDELPGRMSLRYAQDEKYAVESLLGGFAKVRKIDVPEATRQKLLHLLRDHDIDVLHLIGYGAGSGGYESGIVAMDGAVLRAEDLFGPTGLRISRNRPLVYDSCGNGPSWSKVWIERGAGGFACLQWGARDKWAARLSRYFYDAVVKGSTFGQAAQIARRRIRDDAGAGNTTWLGLAMFSHPAGRLTVE